MPVTFRTATHTANPVQGVSEITSVQLLRASCPAQWGICDEVLQSSLGSGPDASSSGLLMAETGLIATVLAAYNHHHALVLRPDDIWIAILVQFNFYVNAHAEELRGKFVAHEGKQEVTVSTGGTRYTVDFGHLATAMTGEMDKFIVDPRLKEWILPRFSTTTENDTVVAAVTMMATLREYFSYKMVLLCGIPRVTLEGEKADWEEILRRTTKLKEYGRETTAWYTLLEPILSRFVRAFDEPEAQENIDFWQRVAHVYNQFSGSTYLSGWITAFCVFTGKGRWQGPPLDEDGNMTTSWRDDKPLELDGIGYRSVDMDSIPVGHADVDVLLDDNGQEFNTVMVAGLVATCVSDSKDASLSEQGVKDVVSPAPGWWIFTKREDGSRYSHELEELLKDLDGSEGSEQ